jgi:hypothetical protein
MRVPSWSDFDRRGLAGAGLIMADLADAYMVDANLCQA